jgi:sec-independent protein translocase protein TatA
MPALGAPELLIILVLVVIVFGAGKLPEIGSALGKGMKEFRSSTTDEPKDVEPKDKEKEA